MTRSLPTVLPAESTRPHPTALSHLSARSAPSVRPHRSTRSHVLGALVYQDPLTFFGALTTERLASRLRHSLDSRLAHTTRCPRRHDSLASFGSLHCARLALLIRCAPMSRLDKPDCPTGLARILRCSHRNRLAGGEEYARAPRLTTGAEQRCGSVIKHTIKHCAPAFSLCRSAVIAKYLHRRIVRAGQPSVEELFPSYLHLSPRSNRTNSLGTHWGIRCRIAHILRHRACFTAPALLALANQTNGKAVGCL